MDDLEQAVAEALGKGSSGSASSSTTAGNSAAADDGEGKYTLFAVISHIGKNTDHGHYVCHVRKNSGQWVLFNDEKVSSSSSFFPLLICVFRLPILRSLH
jgi:ubiquitin carboxyl-terminal hydrolase 5/13